MRASVFFAIFLSFCIGSKSFAGGAELLDLALSNKKQESFPAVSTYRGQVFKRVDDNGVPRAYLILESVQSGPESPSNVLLLIPSDSDAENGISLTSDGGYIQVKGILRTNRGGSGGSAPSIQDFSVLQATSLQAQPF